MSDTSTINVDWKLNQLLSASRASKRYVTRAVTESSGETRIFAPWVPRRLGSAADHPTDHADSEADHYSSGEPPADSQPDENEQSTAELQAQETIEPAPHVLTDLELDDIRAEAFDQGKREAAAELDEKIGDNERRLVELIEQLANSRIDLYDLKRTVADLAIFIAKQAIRAELSVSNQWLDSLIEQCLQEIRQHGNQEITVSLSKADFDANHTRLSARHLLVKFVSDEALQPGDIEVSMGATRISELMNVKLTQISDQLLSTLDGAADHGPEAVDMVLEGEAE